MVMQARIKIDEKSLRRELQQLSSALKGDRGALKAVLSLLGLNVRTFIREHFKTQQRPGGWKRVSPITVALRRQGKGRSRIVEDNPTTGWRVLNAQAKLVKPLTDTGRLVRSLEANRQGSVNKIKKTSVEVGTNLKYADKLHAGGPSQFQVPEDWEARLGRRIPPSRARKWNRFHFSVKGYIRRRVGSSARLVARPIVPKRLTAKQIDELERTARKGVELAMQRSVDRE